MSGTVEIIDSKIDNPILEKLTAKFEESSLKKKGKFSYIPEPLVRERLQEVLGFNWSFEITSETNTLFKNNEAVVIRGKLTAYLPSGRVVVREGYGGALRDNGMSAGDPQKSAASNALKKAAYLLGVGSYLGTDGLESQDDTTSWGSSNSSGYGSNNASGNSGWGAGPAPGSTAAPTAPAAPVQEAPVPTPGSTGGTPSGW